MNNVPDDVRIETYVRAKSMDAIDRTNAKVDAALRAGGAAIGAKVNIDTLPGQLPLICNPEMNELFVHNAQDAFPEVEITNAGHFSASTDMGDVSHLMPAIHPSSAGWTDCSTDRISRWWISTQPPCCPGKPLPA